MAIEKDILVALDTDTVIDRLAEKSELMKKLLLCGEKKLFELFYND